MTARAHYTRWERDRLGKLTLVRDTYEVLGEEEVPFRLERAPLRRSAVTEYAAGFFVSVAWVSIVCVIALNLMGCASADIAGFFPRESLSPEARPALSQEPQVAQTAPVAAPTVLLLDPAEEVRDLTELAAASFRDHGFNVETGPGGIPVAVADEVTDRGSPVDGRSHYDSWCYAAGCNVSAYILLSRVMLESKPQIAQHSLEHEIAHIVSGWGACVQESDDLPMADGMHLTKGHLVSNGNSHYELVDWTSEDVALMMTCIVNGGKHG